MSARPRRLGVSDTAVMWRHILPNAMVATLTFLPFTLSGSVTILASLDFLGFGLPPGSPSLGELVSQGKNNLQAPWLGITAFVVLGGMLTLLMFVGEAVRDAFDPRKAPRLAAQNEPGEVENLTVAFGNRRVVETCQLHARPRRDAGAGRRKRLRQVAHRACRCCSCCRRVPPAPADVVRGRAERDRRAGDGLLRRLRGGVAGMVFQEPMTSLNPLERIGRQIAEAVQLHAPIAPRRRARRGSSSCSSEVGFRRRRAPARRVPASALRRPAPARDDRHGAGQRSRAADRGRADDGARRHHPGADPQAAGRARRRRAGWRCC